jgi:DNA polymerase V
MTLSTPIPYAKSLSLKFPLVSASVEAGFPSPADDHLERGINLNEELIRNPAVGLVDVVLRDRRRIPAGVENWALLPLV